MHLSDDRNPFDGVFVRDEAEPLVRFVLGAFAALMGKARDGDPEPMVVLEQSVEATLSEPAEVKRAA